MKLDVSLATASWVIKNGAMTSFPILTQYSLTGAMNKKVVHEILSEKFLTSDSCF